MGKTPKPLRILADPLFQGEEAFTKLAAQGHHVEFAIKGEPIQFPMEEYDLILGPRCWRMPAELLKLLPVALRAARALKYPKGVVDESE